MSECFPESVVATPDVVIAPDGTAGFRVKVYAGSIPYSQGQVEVAIDAGGGADPSYLRFLTASYAVNVAR